MEPIKEEWLFPTQVAQLQVRLRYESMATDPSNYSVKEFLEFIRKTKLKPPLKAFCPLDLKDPYTYLHLTIISK
jgi:hypothetical protein